MDKLRFGIVGTNSISDWFLNGAKQDPRFCAAAVCSRSIERAKDFAAKHQIPHAFDSLQKMVESDLIDAVYIATPNSVHAEQSILAMKHGKHVLCEKPLASNTREVSEMIAFSEESGMTLMEAVKPTLTPNFRYLQQNIGEAGRIRRYFASYCKYSSRYDKLKEGVVLNAFKPELSNGAVMDIGLYTIYPLAVLFGKPEKIVAQGIILPTGVDGEGSAILKYDGMDAVVIYSKIADSYLPSEIQGENATITIRQINNFSSIEFRDRRSGIATDWSRTQPEDGFYYETAEFIDMVMSGRIESPINSHKASLISIGIIDEIRRQCRVCFPADR